MSTIEVTATGPGEDVPQFPVHPPTLPSGIALFILLTVLAVPAHAEELHVTVTAEAQPLNFNGNPYMGPPLPAAFSYNVNTLTGTQIYEFNNGFLDKFRDTNLLFTHVTASVNGKQLINSPSALGTIEADTGIFPPQSLTYDRETFAGPGLFFETNEFILTTPISPSTQDPLGFMLTHSQFLGNIGAITDQWGLDGFTIKVTEVNVPEPRTLSLLGLGLVGVAFMRRRKKH